MRIYNIIIFLAMFMTISCLKEDMHEYGSCASEVDVALNMSVIGEFPETRAVNDADVTGSTSVTDLIKNFWVLQYDGTGDDALLVGEPEYYPDMNRFLKPESEGGDGGKVKLVRSSVNRKNRVVVLANTFDPLMTFLKDSDFGDLKKRCMDVTGPESHLPSSGDDRYIMFNGTAEVDVNGNSPVQCFLKRNVAKLLITIRNSSSDVTVTSWQIRSVPSVSYYVNSYDLPEAFPALVDFKSVDYPVYYPETPLAPGSGDSEPYIAYVPVNKRGVNSNSTSEQKKNQFVMAGATFLQINASYGSGVPIEYTFYLGENMIDDFNLQPNKAYSYVFDISARGSSETDSRVRELGMVDFTDAELANCYVINPARTAGVRREFKIPVSRVDEFWGTNGYEPNPNYALGNSKEWEVRIISANFDNSSDKVKLDKSKGKGSSDYFSFTVAPDLLDDRTRGSVIVALYAGDAQACWSWHLWITDYAPDEAYLMSPTDKYSYAVTGGVLHRYSGSLWTDGKYRNSFIMDRNLGAFDNATYTANGTGSVYFQFGRKDPFFGMGSYVYGQRWTLYSYENIVKEAPNDAAATIKYVVHNPLTFIKTGTRIAWTKSTKYNPDSKDFSIKWQDPFTSPVYVESLGKPGLEVKEKSVFDPCPAGYKVPDSDLWSDFRRQDAASPTTNVNASSKMLRGFPLFASVNGGLYYWPYSETSGAMDNAPDPAVYYPALGVIQEHGESTYGIGASNLNVYMCSANPYSINSPKYLHANGGSTLGFNTGLGRSHAAPVRCITIK